MKKRKYSLKTGTRICVFATGKAINTFNFKVEEDEENTGLPKITRVSSTEESPIIDVGCIDGLIRIFSGNNLSISVEPNEGGYLLELPDADVIVTANPINGKLVGVMSIFPKTFGGPSHYQIVL